MIYLRIGAAKHWSRTLADQFPGVSEPILNASFGGWGRRGVGDPQSNQTYISFWIALDDGVSMTWSDYDLNGSFQRSNSPSLPPSLNPM
jgi:hypothetical protein